MKYENPLEICHSNKPTASVIWLHGLGADGHDFAPVVEALNLSHIRFILPHAPMQAVTLNNGYIMPAWYDLYGLSPSDKQDSTGIAQSQAFVESLIAKENARGIATNRIALAGFSQGGAIALHTALRHAHPLAGVLALSTYLPLRDTVQAEKHPANQHTPILMAHGSFDEVISLSTCQLSRQKLIDEAYPLTWREYPMAHSVCLPEIDDIRMFLGQILPE